MVSHILATNGMPPSHHPRDDWAPVFFKLFCAAGRQKKSTNGSFDQASSSARTSVLVCWLYCLAGSYQGAPAGAAPIIRIPIGGSNHPQKSQWKRCLKRKEFTATPRKKHDLELMCAVSRHHQRFPKEGYSLDFKDMYSKIRMAMSEHGVYLFYLILYTSQIAICMENQILNIIKW